MQSHYYMKMFQNIKSGTNQKKFQRRKQFANVPEYPGIRETDAIGRVYTVHPNRLECFFFENVVV